MMKDRTLAFSRAVPISLRRGHGQHFRGGVFEQPVLVGGDIGHAQRVDIVDRRAEADGVGDIAGAGLETFRRPLKHGLFEGDVGDHVAAALPGRGLGQNRVTAIDRADAGRPEHLVARKHEEVAADRLHVHRHVRHRLRAVDDDANAMLMGQRRHLRDGRDRAERVGDLRHRDDLGPGPEQFLIGFENDLAAVVHRGDAQFRSGLRAKLLPRHDIGVMLQMADEDFVAFLDIGAAPALRDEVDAFRRAAHEDDVAHGRRVEEAAGFFARGLVGVGGAGRQRMGGAMDVGVLVLVEIRDPLDHRLRFLRGRGVVEPDQLLAAVDAFLKDREVALDRLGVERKAHGAARRARRAAAGPVPGNCNVAAGALAGAAGAGRQALRPSRRH